MVVGRSERCSLLIALPGQRGSACSHRWRDAGRDTPVYLLDLRRPSDGRRAHWVSAGRDAQLQRRLPLAFMTNGLACLSASLWVLRIRRLAPAIGPAVRPKRARDLTFRGSGDRGFESISLQRRVGANSTRSADWAWTCVKTGIRFVREFAPLLASASSERNPSGRARKHNAAETANELRFLDPVRWLSEGQASTFLIAYELSSTTPSLGRFLQTLRPNAD